MRDGHYDGCCWGTQGVDAPTVDEFCGGRRLVDAGQASPAVRRGGGGGIRVGTARGGAAVLAAAAGSRWCGRVGAARPLRVRGSCSRAALSRRQAGHGGALPGDGRPGGERAAAVRARRSPRGARRSRRGAASRVATLCDLQRAGRSSWVTAWSCACGASSVAPLRAGRPPSVGPRTVLADSLHRHPGVPVARETSATATPPAGRCGRAAATATAARSARCAASGSVQNPTPSSVAASKSSRPTAPDRPLAARRSPSPRRSPGERAIGRPLGVQASRRPRSGKTWATLAVR